MKNAAACLLFLAITLVFVASSPAPPPTPGMCSVSAAPLTFGTYTPGQAANLDASCYLTVICTAGIPFQAGMDNGLNYLSPWRRGRNGASFLNYQLYNDSGRTQVWSMTPGSGMVSGTGTGAQQNFQVFGRIPALQQPADGSYSDTVTVTVEYTP